MQVQIVNILFKISVYESIFRPIRHVDLFVLIYCQIVFVLGDMYDWHPEQQKY